MKKWIAFCLIGLMSLSAGAWADTGLDKNTVMYEMAQEGVRYLKPMEGWVAGLTEQDGQEWLIVDSDHGERIFSMPMEKLVWEGIRPDGLADCTPDGEGGLFAVFAARDMDEPVQEFTYLVHLSGEGEILWSKLFVQQVNWGWVRLAPDGLGGVFLVHTSLDNYKQSILRHFSGEGEIRWKKILKTEGFLFKPFVFEPAGEGRALLHATSLSKSKGVYKTLTVLLDTEGRALDVRARDYSFRPDYSAKLEKDYASGEIFFYSAAEYLDTRGTEEIRLPVSALEECTPPKVELADADQEMH